MMNSCKAAEEADLIWMAGHLSPMRMSLNPTGDEYEHLQLTPLPTCLQVDVALEKRVCDWRTEETDGANTFKQSQLVLKCLCLFLRGIIHRTPHRSMRLDLHLYLSWRMMEQKSMGAHEDINLTHPLFLVDLTALIGSGSDGHVHRLLVFICLFLLILTGSVRLYPVYLVLVLFVHLIGADWF